MTSGWGRYSCITSAPDRRGNEESTHLLCLQKTTAECPRTSKETAKNMKKNMAKHKNNWDNNMSILYNVLFLGAFCCCFDCSYFCESFSFPTCSNTSGGLFTPWTFNMDSRKFRIWKGFSFPIHHFYYLVLDFWGVNIFYTGGIAKDLWASVMLFRLAQRLMGPQNKKCLLWKQRSKQTPWLPSPWILVGLWRDSPLQSLLFKWFVWQSR